MSARVVTGCARFLQGKRRLAPAGKTISGVRLVDRRLRPANRWEY